jgi:hypothetical protein
MKIKIKYFCILIDYYINTIIIVINGYKVDVCGKNKFLLKKNRNLLNLLKGLFDNIG